MDEKEAAKRIEQLRDEIRKHDRLYYEEAAPVISDRDYDRLYARFAHPACRWKTAQGIRAGLAPRSNA